MGEPVRYARTSGRGDPVGSVNPTRSKVEQGTWAARPALGNERHPQVDRLDGWPPIPHQGVDRIPPTGRLTVTYLSELGLFGNGSSSVCATCDKAQERLVHAGGFLAVGPEVPVCVQRQHG